MGYWSWASLLFSCESVGR